LLTRNAREVRLLLDRAAALHSGLRVVK